MMIAGVEYEVPISVEKENESLFNEYSRRIDNKQYVDIDRLITEGRMEDIQRICKDCVGAVGMVVFDFDNDDLEEYNRLIPKIEELNRIALEYFKNNDNSKGYACLLETVKIAFDFYLRVMFEDEKVRS